ncbi:MAG: hypothetical protein JOY94_16885, partial [Methylobacteriaceae bacterium]|nr:hypothetical protein [Methylobacteriaceae bacterium]
DHSILAAIEAAERSGTEIAAFSIGGEGGHIFDALEENRALKACCGLFPELVGSSAIDVVGRALAGGRMPMEVLTPHAVLTPQTLSQFYRRDADGWSLAPESARALTRIPDPHDSGLVFAKQFIVGFMPHFPAHDWYRNMGRAMERRARELGLVMRIAAPRAEIAREISSLRASIARVAAMRIRSGDTILINGGEVTDMLAGEIATARDITVVTNSLTVMDRLSDRPRLKLIMTSGEYQAKDRCLVGPSLGALFETMRIDKAFLAVDGISARFGASAADERLALAARRFVEASREVFVLADHSLVGFDANHRIVPAARVDELITDSGSLPTDRVALAAAGALVTLADEEIEEANARRAHPRPGRVGMAV